jgi:hypothetical protein
LQERSAAQPQIENQPLEPSDSSVPATEWVENLRNNLPTLPRHKFPDFETLFADQILDDVGLLPDEALDEYSAPVPLQDADTSMQNITKSLTLDDFVPSTDFQEDAAFLQGMPLEHDAAIEDDSLVPPPLPEVPVCDW